MDLNSRDVGPLFSIIIPTIGRAAMFQEALMSVLNQSIEDLEVIVVDDGSEPPITVDTNDPRVVVIRSDTSRGPAGARNLGIHMSTGRYITFLDDDDAYTSSRLEMVARFLQPGTIVLCETEFMTEVEHVAKVPCSLDVGEVRSFEALFESYTPTVGAAVIHRSDIKIFDEDYWGSEDIEWWIRLSELRLVKLNRVGYLIRQHDEIRVGHGTSARLKGSLMLLRQHREFFRGNPTAAAFRWKRIGDMFFAQKQEGRAMHAYLRSYLLDRDRRDLVLAIRRIVRRWVRR